MEPTQNPYSNSQPVVAQTAPTQSFTPVQTPLQTPAPKKSNTTLVIIISSVIAVLLICCICASALFFISANSPKSSNNSSQNNNDTTPTPTDTASPTATVTATTKDTPIFLNGEDYPPASSNFSNEMSLKQRKLSGKGFITNINALGDPSYTFSIMYKSDWTTSDFDSETYILESSDGKTQTGVMYFPKDTEEYKNMTCYELVKNIYADYKWEGTDTGKVTINGDSWNRVTSTLNKEASNESIGVDQCLKRDDALILHFLLTTKTTWEANKTDYQAMMDDIYVSKVSLKY